MVNHLISLTEEQINKLKEKFNTLPECKIYFYTSFNEINDIEDEELKNKLKEDEKIAGRYLFYKNEHLIFLFRDMNALYHEMTHCFFYNQIENLKLSSSQRYLVDEFLAEYFSTLIVGKSISLNEMSFIICRKKKLEQGQMPYYYGAICAMKEMSKHISKHISENYISIANKIRSAIILDKGNNLVKIDEDVIDYISHHIIPSLN